MNSRGFSLVESLVAMAILAILAAGVLPSMLTQIDSNARSELRIAAISAAQQTFEELRLQDVETFPQSGSAAPRQIRVGDRELEVVVRYCANESFCSATSRHFTVDVFQEGRKIYDAETVYTQLR